MADEGAALALHKAVVARLRADAGVGDLVGDRVYDEPPQSPTRPFVRLGAIEPRPVRTTCGRAERIGFAIQVHSRPEGAGRVEASRIAHAVRAALDEREADLPAAPYEVVSVSWTAQTADRDRDGQSYLAIVAFEALVEGAP